MRDRRRSPWIAPSFTLGGARPTEGEPNRHLRGGVYRHGPCEWRWKIDERGQGLDGPTSWHTVESGRCFTFAGARRELRRYWRSYA